MLTKADIKPKPPFPDRPLSWSQISSFRWSKSQWYSRYVLGEKSESSPEVEFGSMVDKKIQEDPNYLPQVIRYPHLQYKLEYNFEGIPLIGFPDALCLETKKIRDYKTGKNKWNKKRADETGQLTMYLFMIYRIHGIKPDEFECFIDWLPTHVKKGKICLKDKNDVRTFKTKRTMMDVLNFANYIKDTYKEMKEYYDIHR